MKMTVILLLLFAFTSSSCQKDKERVIDDSYQPDVSPTRFPSPTIITNSYFPLPELLTYRYEGQTPDGFEVVEEKRLATTRIVSGIECVVVNFKAFVDGKLIEEANDWYAQDIDGNVWYFGEEVDNYNLDGVLINHAGSWEAGVDGAKPGILMLATPSVGARYREEYYFNEAEDEAEVLSVSETVMIPFGTYTNCVQTHNFTELEPDANEHKFYAPGIGLVKEKDLTDDFEIVLVSIQ